MPKVCLNIEKVQVAGAIPARCIVTGSTQDIVWEPFTFKRKFVDAQSVALKVLHVPLSIHMTVTVALPLTRAAVRPARYVRVISVLDAVLFVALAARAHWIASVMDRWGWPEVVALLAFVPVFVIPFAIYVKYVMDRAPECLWFACGRTSWATRRSPGQRLSPGQGRRPQKMCLEDAVRVNERAREIASKDRACRLRAEQRERCERKPLRGRRTVSARRIGAESDRLRSPGLELSGECGFSPLRRRANS